MITVMMMLVMLSMMMMLVMLSMTSFIASFIQDIGLIRHLR